ncbi:MAG TPA: type II secretion system protein [Acidiferrobacterales bacterium]
MSPIATRPLGFTRCRGFTLLELVAVILLLSILSVSVAVRFQSRDEYSATTQADLLAQHVRHVQTLAMSWGVSLRINVSAGGTAYTVSCLTALGAAPCTAVGDVVTDPESGQAFTVTLENGVTLAPAGSNTDFDSLGRPVSGGVLVSAVPARSFTLTRAARTATVTVQPIGGFVAASY